MCASESLSGSIRIRLRSHTFCALITVALVFTSIAPLSAQQKEYVKAELIADVQAISPGEPLRIGILLTLPPHAHIYWRFPGSSGLATGIEWTLPEGFTVSELQWPNPARFEIKEIDDVTYGYETQALLFADLTPPSDLESTAPIEIAADPYWLVCLESGQCIPESKTLNLELTVGEARSAAHAEIFDGYASRVPTPLDNTVPISVELADAEAGILRFQTKAPWRFTRDESGARAQFFPEEGGPWESKPSDAAEGGDQAALEFTCADERPQHVSGVATLPMRNPATGEKRVFYITLTK